MMNSISGRSCQGAIQNRDAVGSGKLHVAEDDFRLEGRDLVERGIEVVAPS